MIDMEFESAIDRLIESSVGTERACCHATKLGKRKHGDETRIATDELLYFFYKSLAERRLMDMWMSKKVVRKNQWRVDEINALLSQREERPPALLKAKHAASDLLKEMSSELLSELF